MRINENEKRMERRWACWKMDEIIMDNPSWWNMMGDMELQQALHEEDGEHPPPCQEARSRSQPPSNTNIKSRPPPTIRKVAEGWRKEKDEKAGIWWDL